MPCYDGRDQITAASVGKSEELPQVRKLLDERTAMLCRVMDTIEKHWKMGWVDEETQEWWQAHQRWDAERRERGR